MKPEVLHEIESHWKEKFKNEEEYYLSKL